MTESILSLKIQSMITCRVVLWTLLVFTRKDIGFGIINTHNSTDGTCLTTQHRSVATELSKIVSNQSSWSKEQRLMDENIKKALQKSLESSMEMMKMMKNIIEEVQVIRNLVRESK